MLWLDSFQPTCTLRNSLQTTSASLCRICVTDFVS
ncbi:AzlC protein, partial [Streptococcus pneumoniae]